VRPVDDSVNYGIRKGGLAEQLVPVLGVNWLVMIVRGCHTVLQDFEQVVLFCLARLGQAPVVNDQDVNARDPGQQSRIGAISAAKANSSKRRGARR